MNINNSSNEAIQKLKVLSEKKRNLLNDLCAEIGRLSIQRDELSCHLIGIQEAIKELSADDQPVNGQRALIGKYAALKLSPAVLDVVSSLGKPPCLVGPGIVSLLKSGGYSSDSKSLYSSVYAVAMRLVDQGKIREGKKGGKRSFVSNQEDFGGGGPQASKKQ